MNPYDAHSVRMAGLTSKLDGQKIGNIAELSLNQPKAGENAITKAPEIEVPADNAPEPAAAEAEAAPAPAVEASPAPAAEPKTERISKNLQRSLQLQRQADEAQRRAKSETAKMATARREADVLERQAKAREQDLLQKESRLAQIEDAYTRKLEKLKTDPLGFAKEHGVSGADIADYVRSGSDPTAKQLELTRQQMAEALKQVRDEGMSEINALKRSIAERETEAAQAQTKRNFFAYLEKAEKEVPEQFQALGMVYSPEDIWNRATELADKSQRLQLGWDGDRLLEELETEAKADPRWVRLQSRFEAKKAPTKSNASAEVRSNAQEEVSKPAAKRETPPRSDTGQFTRPSTPAERHAQRLEAVIRSQILSSVVR